MAAREQGIERVGGDVRRIVATCLVSAALAGVTGGERLALGHVALDLPGPPAKVIPTDLNGDQRQDLLVVVAYTEVQSVGLDRVEDMVQITTVIPTVFDRREVRAYLARPEGGYAPAGEPLRLDTSTLHLEAGPPDLGVVALTDEGLARLRFEAGPAPLRLETILHQRPVLAGAGSFFAALNLVHDLNGDGRGDFLFPGPDALLVYLGTPEGLDTAPASRVPLPTSVTRELGAVERLYPLPEVADLDGDAIVDLVFDAAYRPGEVPPVHVLLGSREGTFRPLRGEPLDCADRLTDLRLAAPEPPASPWPSSPSALLDLDGDGRAEAVFAEERSRGDSFRKEMQDAKRPLYTYRFHRLGPGLVIEPTPYFETSVVGHELGGDQGFGEPGSAFDLRQFEDLDGDGRQDLITLTLDFSLFQVIKILATRSIGIGLDFHVYAQRSDGTFAKVENLDLSEKLKLDLNNLKLGRFAQFAGDFDGDGRRDFVHLGRGRQVTIHAGRAGCVYPKAPDLTIKLDEEPESLDLVRIEDLDGDGRSDLRITRPLPGTDPDITAPVRLELYLSGGGS